ncbi:MAG: long-chain fatty acid--CoA ligase [Chloroflexi bacterium]|nr:long-chain fatty acid--CoA ligase [Chloroflexota bacterium]
MDLGYAFFSRNARLYPNKPAIVDGEQCLSFSQLNERVNRLVNALAARGVEKGDRVAILAQNCGEYYEVFGAGEKGGRIVVPLNWRLVGRELCYQINNAEPAVLIVGEGYVDLVESIRPEIPCVQHYLVLGDQRPGFEAYESFLAEGSPAEPEVEIKPDDPVYILYTSGTTGIPKGAVLTQRGQMHNAELMLGEQGIRPGERVLTVLPMFHLAAKNVMNYHLMRGNTGYVMAKFDPGEVLETIEREKITHVHVAPTMLVFMLEVPDISRYDLSSLNTILYATAPMPVDLLKRCIEVFGPVFQQAYGQTESGPLITLLHKEDHKTVGTPAELRRLGSCGLPVIGVQVRVVDENGSEVRPGEVGEITARSDLIMSGYWNNPEATAQAIRDGWLHTGDLATVDEDGYVYIVDRKKDMIISGGENVYPREVEEVLYTHPAVLEVSVIGAPDPRWGESVRAVVSLRQGTTVTEQELIDYCRGRLAGYKRPKSVVFVDTFPKNPSGKILKRELRKMFSQPMGT